MKKPIADQLKALKEENARLRMRIAELESMLPSAAASPALNKEEAAFIARCKEIVDRNLRNEQFTVQTMAGAFAMSHSTLFKKLKSLTGQSIIEFVNERRILKARQCFSEGMTNVSAVAELCGYKDIKTFRTIFKRHTGLNPKQYCLKTPRFAPER